ncbi:uncharacterized protein LOC144478990 [Augochlora pura]
MSIITFSEEFTQLIGRWREFVPNGDGTVAPRLTNQEIIDAVRNVLRLTLHSNSDIPDYSPVRTPVTGIEVHTPATPVAPKFNRSQMNSSIGRYRSLDTLITQDKEQTKTNEDQSGGKFDGDATIVYEQKNACEEHIKSIRRLSNVAARSGTVRPSTMAMRPTMPSKQRRSTAVPATPTSSKFNLTLNVEKITNPMRRRSIAIGSVKNTPSVSTTNRTPSVAVAPMPRSPISTRNSKYAYVQSTIPKTARAIRKSAK